MGLRQIPWSKNRMHSFTVAMTSYDLIGGSNPDSLFEASNTISSREDGNWIVGADRAVDDSGV